MINKTSKFIKVSNAKCDLIFFNKIRSFIKNLDRVFFLIGKKNCTRGDHAHKECTQFFFSLKSNVTIIANNGKKEKKIILKYGQIIKIEPLTWVKIRLDKGQIVGVFCNKKYSKKDYIRNYNNFLKLIKKKSEF